MTETVETIDAIETFDSLGLSEATLKAIRAKGFEQPSPIQRLTIPVLLANQNDIIGQAQTGTGKTAAFGLPILEHVTPGKGGVQALMLVPTRELALQVTDELMSLKHGKTSITTIYGGASMDEQLRRLKKGVDIVVGTPGRILDHLRRGTLDLRELGWLVLDEADEMLNMGFIDDVDEILSKANPERRMLLFSATMPQRVAQLSKKYMRDVQLLKVEAKNLITDLTDQIYFEVRESDKFDALTRIIDVENDIYAIVFCRTKVQVDENVNRLLERGYAADGLHGDVSQAQREKILRKFKRKNINILVATDVAARGIDVNNLTHVINYSLPQDSESYVHRIGRTGRAGNQGTAITFISPSEYRQFKNMSREVKADIRKEDIPTAQDIVQMKKKNITDEINEIIESGMYTEYTELAEQILSNNEPAVVLSAFLKMSFKNDLDEATYPEIRTFSVDRRGTARIFLAMGRYDGLDARGIVDLLRTKSGLSNAMINDVRVKDEFSFVTVPFDEAERVIRALNKDVEGERPLAEIAADAPSDDAAKGGRRGGGGGGGRRGGSREGGRGFGGRSEGGRSEGGHSEGGRGGSRSPKRSDERGSRGGSGASFRIGEKSSRGGRSERSFENPKKRSAAGGRKKR